MKRHKKLIIAAVLAAVVLAGSIGGAVLAADNSDDSGSAANFGEFIDRVCAIYADKSGGDTIDNPEALKEALTEARTQMREAAMENRLQGLTDEQKEALKEWWGERPGLTDEQKEALQEWRNSRPEDLPFGPRMRGHGGFRVFAPCVPPVEE